MFAINLNIINEVVQYYQMNNSESDFKLSYNFKRHFIFSPISKNFEGSVDHRSSIVTGDLNHFWFEGLFSKVKPRLDFNYGLTVFWLNWKYVINFSGCLE